MAIIIWVFCAEYHLRRSDSLKLARDIGSPETSTQNSSGDDTVAFSIGSASLTNKSPVLLVPASTP